MALPSIEAIVSALGALLVLGAMGGAAWVTATEIRVRAIRHRRLAGGPQIVASPNASIVSPLLAGVRRLGQQSAVRDPAKLSQLRTRLMQAGFYSREAPVIYLGIRAVALVIATAGVILILPLIAGGKTGLMGVGIACLFAGLAMLGPDQVLKMRKTKREREYSEGFPDLLDLLVASVEAGLSLDMSVTRVTEELARRYPTLAIHLHFLVLELRAGKARKEAWSAFADRLGIEDARQLATMLRQAEEMGTSLGDTLTVFSQDMRSKRMLRAEEKAMALSAKLTVPLILFIFPSLLGSLMLPAIARLMHVFGKH